MIEYDTVLGYFPREMKGAFPFKRSALPISTVCGTVKLEQVAFQQAMCLILVSSPS